MSSPGHPNNRHVSFHETTRQPPPYRHHPYQPSTTPGMRIPQSPLNPRYYEGPPPRWHEREDPAYYSPYDMPPREQAPPRPYLPPMHVEDPRRDSRQEPRMRPPPPQEYIAKREGPPPRIRYRYSDYGPLSPKRTKRYPGPPPPPQHPEAAAGTAGTPNTPGALSLLAKVAMGGNSDSSKQLNHQASSEYASPVRRMPPSPLSAQSPRPILWTPPDANYRHFAPPPRGEWMEQPHPHPHPYPRRDYYPPTTWTYEGPQTPPALVERPSFDEAYYSPEGAYAQYDYPSPPSSDYRRYPPSPDARHQYITPTASRDMEQAEEVYHTSPYTYVQQPRLKEETILRKKFSWKHYPELEQFLIASRDEYLRHSALNYTAEQKQYNNWLTERLMDEAARNHYVFDPEEFNFVAIRDRIRCYYKSYVQTARKRGQTIKKKQQAATSPTPGTTNNNNKYYTKQWTDNDTYCAKYYTANDKYYAWYYRKGRRQHGKGVGDGRNA